jgi:phage tail sheath gpL-like
MPAYPPGFPLSQKTPGIYFAVVLGGAGTSPGTAQKTILIYGSMITANITGAGPSFTVVKGSASVLLVYGPIGDKTTADNLFGRGSELSLGIQAALSAAKAATIYAIATTAAGAAATMTLTMLASSPTATSINVFGAGRMVQYNAVSTDTATTVALGIATAVINNPDLPFTAQNTAGVVTFTHKFLAARGNFTPIRIQLVSGSTSVVATAGSLAAVLNGFTATLSGGTVSGGAYLMSGGTGTESVASALAITIASLFDRQVFAYIDTTNAALLVTQLNSMAAVTTDLWQQGIVPSVDTIGNATTLAVAQNASRLQLAWEYNAECVPVEIAATVAAVRLFGDSQFGGGVFGEVTDPAANLNGAIMGTIPIAYAVGDRPTAANIETALNNGITPLAPAGARPGFAQMVASITTRSLDGSSAPNYAVYKTKVVTVSDFVAYDSRVQLTSRLSGQKLAPDNADASSTKLANTTTPNTVRQAEYSLLKGYEGAAIIINVDANAPLLTCVQDTSAPGGLGRLIMNIPSSVIPDMDQIAGTIQQL